MPDNQGLPPGAQPFATEEKAADAQLAPVEPRGAALLFDRLVVAGFVLAIVAPALLLLAHVHVRQIENRPARDIPAVTLSGLADASWPAGVDGYLIDHMWPRPYAVRLRALAYWVSGATGTSKVLRGVDNWLFVRDELQPSCRFTAAQQAAALSGASRRFDAEGIEFRFLIAPDKHAIYPDKLPPDNPFPPSCVDTQRPALDAAIADMGGTVIDATGALQTARATAGTADLYYPEDTHWTPTGAATAVGELARSFGTGLWSPEDVQVKGTKRRLLDTPSLLGLRTVAVAPRVVLRPEMTLHRVDVQVPVTVKAARTVFRITSSGTGTLLPGRTLVVYDSFFGIDTSLVAPYFADTTWVHNEDLIAHPELARLLGPFDRIVVERVARAIFAVDLNALLWGLSEAAGG